MGMSHHNSDIAEIFLLPRASIAAAAAARALCRTTVVVASTTNVVRFIRRIVDMVFGCFSPHCIPEADDGTQSFVSLDPISVDERLAAATHGSDPMIASMYSRDESLGWFLLRLRRILRFRSSQWALPCSLCLSFYLAARGGFLQV